MTTQIRIEVWYGASSVTVEDRERAEAAALAVLGDIEPEIAYAEFIRQLDELGSYEGLSGLAATWIEAERAANAALTEGWYNPAGAACSIAA